MSIAVLGTGDVVRAIAGKLVQLGHEVTMGSRTAANAPTLSVCYQHQSPDARW